MNDQELIDALNKTEAERAVMCCFLKMDLTDHVILSTKTREPLSEEFLMALAEECTAQFFNGVHQNATIHFARAIEQAHGIGVTK